MSLYRKDALEIAKGEVGVKESPPNSNDGPRVREYQKTTGAYRAPWCASFVHWAFEKAGFKIDNALPAYVPSVEQWLRAHNWVVSHPAPGDIVIYNWDGGPSDHMGIVSRVGEAHFEAVEGNTSYGSNSNGGEVMLRWRRYGDVQAFGRIPGGPPARPEWYEKALSMEPMWAWFAWHDHGAPPNLRPTSIPKRVPKLTLLKWAARYKIHKGLR